MILNASEKIPIWNMSLFIVYVTHNIILIHNPIWVSSLSIRIHSIGFCVSNLLSHVNKNKNTSSFHWKCYCCFFFAKKMLRIDFFFYYMLKFFSGLQILALTHYFRKCSRLISLFTKFWICVNVRILNFHMSVVNVWGEDAKFFFQR